MRNSSGYGAGVSGTTTGVGGGRIMTGAGDVESRPWRRRSRFVIHGRSDSIGFVLAEERRRETRERRQVTLGLRSARSKLQWAGLPNDANITWTYILSDGRDMTTLAYAMGRCRGRVQDDASGDLGL